MLSLLTQAKRRRKRLNAYSTDRGARESEPRSRANANLCDDLDHFYVTDAAERFAKVAERFLGTTPNKLEAIEVYGRDELRQLIVE